MTLKELRKSKRISQAKAASLLGVSLRSYKDYENKSEKTNTLKYKYMYDSLSKYGLVDEEHGILEISDIIDICTAIFEEYEVDCCYLFGSYSRNAAKENSDVDLLVVTEVTGMKFFGLAEKLREGLHKKVDLLNSLQLNNNQDLLNQVLVDGIKIYCKKR